MICCIRLHLLIVRRMRILSRWKNIQWYSSKMNWILLFATLASFSGKIQWMNKFYLRIALWVCIVFGRYAYFSSRIDLCMCVFAFDHNEYSIYSKAQFRWRLKNCHRKTRSATKLSSLFLSSSSSSSLFSLVFVSYYALRRLLRFIMHLVTYWYSTVGAKFYNRNFFSLVISWY